jgi:hypothetical protein
VLLAFDGDLAHKKARQFFAYLLEEFGEELQLEPSWWSFEQLRQDRFAEAAAHAAATASGMRIHVGFSLTGHASGSQICEFL